MSNDDIYPGGGDTGFHYNVVKRLTLVSGLIKIQGRKILDCGCGQGVYLLAFLKHGGDPYGIEYSAEKVRAFHSEYPSLANRVIKGNLEQIDFGNDEFDLALINEVLEHVSNEKRVLQEIHRVLRPEGELVLFSPNRFYPFETHGVYWKANGKKIAHYVPFVPYIPLRVGRIFLTYWARNYWPQELRNKVVESGFQITEVGYVWQTFENISGNRPAWLSPIASSLRAFGNTAEKIPLLRAFGASQYVVARKST